MSSIEPTAYTVSAFQQGIIIAGVILLLVLFAVVWNYFWGGQEVEKL